MSKIYEHVVKIFNQYTHPQKIGEYTENIIKIILILIVMEISIKFCIKLVDKFFDNRSKFKIMGEEKRINTIKGIVNSIVRYTIYFVSFASILEMIGIKISSLLAAAGIGGLAIGFGAQSLVKDIITGFFILLENQFHVGDYVQIGNFSGIVEDMTLRVTTVRDFNGDLHIIPNGTIDKVTNKCRGDMRALVEVGISYEQNIDHAISVLKDLCEEIKKENEKIVEGPNVLGVSRLGESDVVLSIVAKTIPMEQWAVERELRKRIKEKFDEKGIEIPYPRRVVISDQKS
ncbi:mechanosensitive ion channel family protein [Inediibacterium massiliense]|uniref:mechanosensitive ion channel family protein n=1 Tax=Inediibacterium massiliense TaxID=1658111 RepID=UPI000A9DE344|nr:mechanosensitive ion channel family protein [Inediibacterium massiliense]